jgi:hypothetical protein
LRRRQPQAGRGDVSYGRSRGASIVSSALDSRNTVPLSIRGGAGCGPPLPCLLCLLSDVGPGGRIALVYVLRAGWLHDAMALRHTVDGLWVREGDRRFQDIG